MKHFVVFIHYDVPLEKIDSIVQDHRNFLQQGYESGMLLMSGPLNPRNGGLVVCRATDAQEVISFFENDPYHLNNFAHYEIVEFNPVKHQSFLQDWVAQ